MRPVAVLDAARKSHAVRAVGELQILDVGPFHGRGALGVVDQLDVLLAVGRDQSRLVVLLLLGRLAHDERLDAPGRTVLRRIDMDRQKQVALALVSDVGPGLQVVDQLVAQLLVRLAGIDHLHPGHPLFDERPELERHRQREILLLHAAPDGPGKLASVTGIEHDDLHPLRPLRNNIFRPRSVNERNRADRQENCKKLHPGHAIVT